MIEATTFENGMYQGVYQENGKTIITLLINPNDSNTSNIDKDVCYLIFDNDYIEYGKNYNIGIQAVKYSNNYTRSDIETIEIESPQTPNDLPYL